MLCAEGSSGGSLSSLMPTQLAGTGAFWALHSCVGSSQGSTHCATACCTLLKRALCQLFSKHKATEGFCPAPRGAEAEEHLP